MEGYGQEADRAFLLILQISEAEEAVDLKIWFDLVKDDEDFSPRQQRSGEDGGKPNRVGRESGIQAHLISDIDDDVEDEDNDEKDLSGFENSGEDNDVEVFKRASKSSESAKAEISQPTLKSSTEGSGSYLSQTRKSLPPFSSIRSSNFSLHSNLSSSIDPIIYTTGESSDANTISAFPSNVLTHIVSLLDGSAFSLDNCEIVVLLLLQMPFSFSGETVPIEKEVFRRDGTKLPLPLLRRTCFAFVLMATVVNIVVGSLAWVEDDMAWIDEKVVHVSGEEIKIICTNEKVC
ncbi:hypothetical protein MRB53_009644 [Persea americana]|uniref:Uncharacterized protein n=1 Tax=Persea americana TaxID=3435 RepID=A0ACC2LPR3_PERAE|nr:hypothetical protein MRB53_009644 [Persea americana]